MIIHRRMQGRPREPARVATAGERRLHESRTHPGAGDSPPRPTFFAAFKECSPAPGSSSSPTKSRPVGGGPASIFLGLPSHGITPTYSPSPRACQRWRWPGCGDGVADGFPARQLDIHLRGNPMSTAAVGQPVTTCLSTTSRPTPTRSATASSPVSTRWPSAPTSSPRCGAKV